VPGWRVLRRPRSAPFRVGGLMQVADRAPTEFLENLRAHRPWTPSQLLAPCVIFRVMPLKWIRALPGGQSHSTPELLPLFCARSASRLWALFLVMKFGMVDRGAARASRSVRWRNRFDPRTGRRHGGTQHRHRAAMVIRSELILASPVFAKLQTRQASSSSIAPSARTTVASGAMVDAMVDRHS
jgi:hypothetical protein